jgi:hypothetical protein
VNFLCTQLLLTHESRLSVMHNKCLCVSISRKDIGGGGGGGGQKTKIEKIYFNILKKKNQNEQNVSYIIITQIGRIMNVF